MSKDKSLITNNRIAYILLAVFLGVFGIHNFYAGRYKQAIIQLILGLLAPLTAGITGIISGIWAIIDAISVRTNGKDIPMHM